MPEAKKLHCPVCKKKNLSISTERIDLLGEGIIVVSFVCDCGFKSSDTYPELQGEPSVYTLDVTEKELTNYVVKSSSCEIKIPELELDITPGPISEGYISTVEGVLLRIEDSLKGNKKIPKNFFEKLGRFRENGGFTLIFEDVMGNSKIFGGKKSPIK